MLSVYSYQAYNHYIQGKEPVYTQFGSETFRCGKYSADAFDLDMQYTQLEATILDLALVLHMEHGGGNNSTFTTHVVTSSGTDTYSAMAAALGS